jgi:hypothetical protein
MERPLEAVTDDMGAASEDFRDLRAWFEWTAALSGYPALRRRVGSGQVSFEEALALFPTSGSVAAGDASGTGRMEGVA